jgi:hypothetical protein
MKNVSDTWLIRPTDEAPALAAMAARHAFPGPPAVALVLFPRCSGEAELISVFRPVGYPPEFLAGLGSFSISDGASTCYVVRNGIVVGVGSWGRSSRELTPAMLDVIVPNVMRFSKDTLRLLGHVGDDISPSVWKFSKDTLKRMEREEWAATGHVIEADGGISSTAAVILPADWNADSARASEPFGRELRKLVGGS